MAISVMTPAIKSATAADSERVVVTLTRAFHADPVVRWVYPDLRQYSISWPEVMRVYSDSALTQGIVDYTDGFTGVALWLPTGVGPDEEALAMVLEQSVPERDQADVFGLLEQMGAFHPSEPHWYLPFIGVEPLYQGNGAGSALLRHALVRCDRDGLPAYLEATTPRSRLLYQRHGFEVIDTLQLGSSPPMWPMLRMPH